MKKRDLRIWWLISSGVNRLVVKMKWKSICSWWRTSLISSSMRKSGWLKCFRRKNWRKGTNRRWIWYLRNCNRCNMKISSTSRRNWYSSIKSLRKRIRIWTLSSRTIWTGWTYICTNRLWTCSWWKLRNRVKNRSSY